jgi:DNA polymerase IV
MSHERTILHVDMDAFYASIEQRDHPEFRGKPVIIGSAPNERGVVSTCSYEARKFGVHSAMPSRTAGKLCPEGIFVPPNMEKYRKESKSIMTILRDFTPIMECISVDEAFLDITQVRTLLGNGMEIGRKIKDRLLKEHGLTASVGVAANKFLAKLASDLEKPNGLTFIGEENKISVLAPLSVSKLWGVGKVTQSKLERHGLKTIGDIQRAGLETLRSVLGRYAEDLYPLALGMDSREVEPISEAKSIGSEHTFDVDTSDDTTLRKTLLHQAEKIASELRHEKFAAKTIALKLRYSDFSTITRQTTLKEPTQSETVIYDHSLSLMESERFASEKIRLIGISVSHFAPPLLQLDLFDVSVEKKQRLAAAVDTIRAQHGFDSIKRATE